MSITMARDTTVQFRMDSDIKDAAFSVFREMGITPSEAVRVFFKQVQKTRTLPFVVVADQEVAGAMEPGYAEWLRARLADTVGKLDRGEMKSYPSEQARAILKDKLAVRRKALKSQAA
ncbi:MAG: type II toxin-antitoxin system RelB/DinJ family antitoxin [Aeromicrobium sp.]|nr:type II toxin-antitoxin system RelB/DinJ family antitoxin [Burkholderiales bacterium]